MFFTLLNDIFSLNESQVDINCPEHQDLIPGFNFEHSEAKYNGIASRMSRVSLWSKSTLNYERLQDLENYNNHTVIIKI